MDRESKGSAGGSLQNSAGDVPQRTGCGYLGKYFGEN